MQPDAARALAEQTAEVVRRAIDSACAPLVARIAALEQRPAPELEKGDPGAPGEPGPPGIGVKSMLIDRAGHLRAVLADGSDHDLGEVVGRDGKPGVDGKPGEPGEGGNPGAPGIGIGDVERTAEDEVLVKLSDGRIINLGNWAGKDGRDGADAYAGQARGLFDADAEYRAMDTVSWSGSEWRAKRDNPGPLPGDGWMLSAQRGKRGDRGDRGEQGREGKPGKDAPEMVQCALNAESMIFQIALSNGEVLEADFGPLATAITGALQDG